MMSNSVSSTSPLSASEAPDFLTSSKIDAASSTSQSSDSADNSSSSSDSPRTQMSMSKPLPAIPARAAVAGPTLPPRPQTHPSVALSSSLSQPITASSSSSTSSSSSFGPGESMGTVSSPKAGFSNDEEFRRKIRKGDLLDYYDTAAHRWSVIEVIDIVIQSGNIARVYVHFLESGRKEWAFRDLPMSSFAPPFTKSSEPAAPPPARPPVSSHHPHTSGPARSAAAPTAVHVPAPLSSAVSSASPSSSQSSLYPHVGEGSAPLPLDVGMTNPSLSRSSSAPPLSPASAASSSSLATGDSSPSFVVAPVAASVPSPSASEEPGGHEPGGASTSAASLLHDATATPSAPAASPAATPLTAGDRIQLAIGNALVNVPRNLEFGANLHPGDVLDAMDTEAEWRLADVLKATADQVFVHYQSWSNKWDEWISRDSARLQPPRTKTSGYTGPTLKTPPAAHVAPSPSPPAAVGSHVSNYHTQYNYFDSHIVPFPVAPPAYAHTYSAPQRSPISAAPQRSYDCSAHCKWKRVLSMGLGHKEIAAIDKLFATCCRLQDDYQKVILGESSDVQLLQNQLTELEKDIVTTRASLSENAPAFLMDQCIQITDNIKSGINEIIVTQQRQRLAEAEQRYMNNLKKLFDLLEVPSNRDGNCLFGAIGRGHIINQQYKLLELQNKKTVLLLTAPTNGISSSAPSSRSSSPARSPLSSLDSNSISTPPRTPLPSSGSSASSNGITPSQQRPISATLLLSLINDSDVSKMAMIANQYRKRCIDNIQNNWASPISPVDNDHNKAIQGGAHHPAHSFGSIIQREVQDILLQQQDGKHANATSKAIWQEMLKVYPNNPLDGVQDVKACVDAYCAVMSNEGIYGTIIEIESLSRFCQLPIAIYYKLDQQGSDANPQPARIIGEQYLNSDNMIISLAYYMGNKHYNLLVPKPTIFSLRSYIQSQSRPITQPSHPVAASTPIASAVAGTTSTNPFDSLSPPSPPDLAASPDVPTHHRSLTSPPVDLLQPERIVASLHAASASFAQMSNASAPSVTNSVDTPDLLSAANEATQHVASPPRSVRAISAFFHTSNSQLSSAPAAELVSSSAGPSHDALATPSAPPDDPLVGAVSQDAQEPSPRSLSSSSSGDPNNLISYAQLCSPSPVALPLGDGPLFSPSGTSSHNAGSIESWQPQYLSSAAASAPDAVSSSYLPSPVNSPLPGLPSFPNLPALDAPSSSPPKSSTLV